MNLHNFFDNLSSHNGLHIIMRNREQEIVFLSDEKALSLETHLSQDVLNQHIKIKNKWYDVKICVEEKTGYRITTFYDISLYIRILKESGAHIVVKDETEKDVFWSSRLAQNLSKINFNDEKVFYVENENSWYECYETVFNFEASKYLIHQYIEVTHYIEENKELKHDILTGLYNRHGILEQLEYMIHHTDREEFIIIIGDIDYFKLINDTFGHDVGDEVLKSIGAILNSVITNGFCGRYGGEEFLIVLDTDDMEEAYQSIERIRKQLETTEFIVGDDNIHLTLSFGISKYKKGDCKIENKDSCLGKIIKTADIALMTSKQTGRNKTLIYNEHMQKNLLG